MESTLNRKEIFGNYPDVKDKIALERFVSYVIKMDTEPKSKTDSSPKNPFMRKLSNEKLITLYKRVEKEGLTFDGKHITLQSTGISYDYVVYKNKMLLVYPDSLIDVQLVYKGDTFKFSKESGKVNYTHELADPFDTKTREIIGGYCVIKNIRGEFLTTLSKEKFELHRAIAKTDLFWAKWYEEMCLKTLIKKAVRIHYDDIYSEMEKEEESQYDLEKLTEDFLKKWQGKSQKQEATTKQSNQVVAEWEKNISGIKTRTELMQYVAGLDTETIDDPVHSKLLMAKKESL